MLDLFKFYFDHMVQLFHVLNSWELVPGVTYLGLILGVALISIFIKLIKFGVHSNERQYWNSLARDSISKKRGGK